MTDHLIFNQYAPGGVVKQIADAIDTLQDEGGGGSLPASAGPGQFLQTQGDDDTFPALYDAMLATVSVFVPAAALAAKTDQWLFVPKLFFSNQYLLQVMVGLHTPVTTGGLITCKLDGVAVTLSGAGGGVVVNDGSPAGASFTAIYFGDDPLPVGPGGALQFIIDPGVAAFDSGSLSLYATFKSAKV